MLGLAARAVAPEARDRGRDSCAPQLAQKRWAQCQFISALASASRPSSAGGTRPCSGDRAKVDGEVALLLQRLGALGADQHREDRPRPVEAEEGPLERRLAA